MTRVNVITDNVYDDYKRATMDLFVPEDVENPPLVMMMHGGGWFGGHRMLYTSTAYALSRLGFAVANVGYTLSPELIWPEMGYQIYKAGAWLKANAQKYGYDGSRVVTFGSSAGSQLSLTLQAFAAYWKAEGVVSGDCPEVIGTVAQCVAFDLIQFDEDHRRTFMKDAAPETVSPAHIPHEKYRSIFVVHSEPDNLFPSDKVAEWVDALKQSGVDADMYLSPVGEHGFVYNLARDEAQKALEATVPYLERVFGVKAIECDSL